MKNKLIQTVEDYFKNKGFENINLTTYGFQAPEFYEKCGFKIEFIRENKENPKLNKYYLVKYFWFCQEFHSFVLKELITKNTEA